MRASNKILPLDLFPNSNWSQSQGRILPLDLLNLIIVMYFVFLEQCVVTMLTVIVKETFTASKIVSLIMQLRLRRRCNHFLDFYLIISLLNRCKKSWTVDPRIKCPTFNVWVCLKCTDMFHQNKHVCILNRYCTLLF